MSACLHINPAAEPHDAFPSRCHLVRGHTGPHQVKPYGTGQVWEEWDNDDQANH